MPAEKIGTTDIVKVDGDPRQMIWLDGSLIAIEDIHKSLRVTMRAAPAFRKYINITFQNGPIEEVGINGAGIEDVIDLLIERLRGFNEGDMRCRENSLAVTALEEARNWLTLRTINRIQQGVEGYNRPHQS